MSDSVLLQAEGIHFAYPGGIHALDGVDFRAARGEFVAVLGANGSGKTTLMKILMRLLRPQQGSVRLAGSDIHGMRAAEIYRRVGMVFQNPADQLFAATVEQDVAFGPRNQGLDEAEIARRVSDALEAVDAAALRQRPIHQLSFGEQKRACLAGVLAMRPEVLVLDEPTAGLDPAGEAHMIELLMRLRREQQITLILSTHAVDLLPVLADRVCVLRRGRIHGEGSAANVLTNRAAAAEAGLRLPLVAQLFEQLKAARPGVFENSPLTVETARDEILRRLNHDGADRAGQGGAP